MGAPQFMPGSFRRFAVDGDGDGKRDLWTDWADVLASVANYFRRARLAARTAWWSPMSISISSDASGLDSRPPGAHRDGSLAALEGRAVRESLPDDAPAMLIVADEPDQVRFRVGFNNFYVITRYNRSPLYAMAVHDLADADHSSVCSAMTAALRQKRAVGHTGPPCGPRAADPGRRRAKHSATLRARPDTAARSSLRRRIDHRDPGRRAASRTAQPQRQSAVLRPCSAERYFSAATRAQATCERGVASWYGPDFHGSRHRDRRDLRHVRDDGRPQDTAAAALRAGHEPAQRP